jgi:hypothetical protein
MRSLLLCVALALPALWSPAHAEDLPKLSGTDLYKTVARGCRLLLRYKVQLDSVELCNDKTYPVVPQFEISSY